MKLSLEQYQDFTTEFYKAHPHSSCSANDEFEQQVAIVFGKSPFEIAETLLRKVFHLAITPNTKFTLSKSEQVMLLDDIYRCKVELMLRKHPELKFKEVEL